MRNITITVILAVLASAAYAEITYSLAVTDNSSVLGPGYVTNDILISTDTDWLQSQLLIELTSGNIYQTPSIGQWFPQTAYWSMFPELEFDSFLTATGFDNPNLAGCAGNLDGDDQQFDTEEIDIAWFNVEKDDIGQNMLIARITLSTDAQGTWKFISWAHDPTFSKNYPEVYGEGMVNYGYLPEPATIVMLGVGAAVLLRRRRKVQT